MAFIDNTNGTSIGLSGLAFLAGVLATIVTAYAVVSKRKNVPQKDLDPYDGWEESLGI
jgi:hypothetical protein